MQHLLMMKKMIRIFDPYKEFVEPGDLTIEGKDEGDTFQVEKHSHTLNFSEAGEFVVWVCGECRGITRIHRSPSRPRPSMRPTAAFINIHEHLI